MHHTRDISQELASSMALSEADKLGPTGRFPEGKLVPQDEGEIAFAVGTVKGKVVINFGTPVASVGMSVSQARELAQSLRKHANQIEPRKRQ